MKPVVEQIDLGEQQSIVAFEYAKRNFETPWHCHPQHELTYIEQSSGTRFIGDHATIYQPGELILLRSNLPHCWKNNEDENAFAHSIVVQWNKGIYTRAPELAAVFDMLKAASRGIIFESEIVAPLIPFMKRLLPLKGPHLYVHLLELLVQLATCRYTTLSDASFEEDLPPEFGSRMGKIHEFINANYTGRVYLKEVAGLVNMTEQSFSRFFTKMMGRSFFVFLNEYRINMACRMLIDTDWSVSEIGYACGFDSMPFYHKQFAKYKNKSPLKYRLKFSKK